MSEPGFRAYRDGDEHGIIDLFWQVSPQGRTVDYWRWMNARGPHGKSIVELIEIDGRITGHYAVMPVELKFGDRRVHGGFAMQVCTHTAHRGLAVLRPMCDRVWQSCAEAGMEFVYGFPNAAIWPIYKRMMGWESIVRFRALQYDLASKGLPEIAGPTKLPVRRIHQFDDRFDGLWRASAVAAGPAIAVPRDARYLNWRFCDNPAQHYPILAIWDGDTPAGYAVLKFHRDGARRVGHIIDLIACAEEHDAIAGKLIAEAFAVFEGHGCDIVSCWFFDTDPVFPMLDDLGFHDDGFETLFGFKPISTAAPQGWRLTMADSDAF